MAFAMCIYLLSYAFELRHAQMQPMKLILSPDNARDDDIIPVSAIEHFAESSTTGRRRTSTAHEAIMAATQHLMGLANSMVR
jgi:hypothetical protein